MVQAFAPHAADQAFHIRILPRAPWRRNDLFHAHRRHGRAERLPVCAVPVADQVPRRRAPRECLSDLLCDPRHRRVRRYTEMHDLAALVVEHDEPEQEVERGRGDHEEIDRRQAIGVICKECPPRLRWRRWRRWVFYQAYCCRGARCRNRQNKFQAQGGDRSPAHGHPCRQHGGNERPHWSCRASCPWRIGYRDKSGTANRRWPADRQENAGLSSSAAVQKPR